MAESVNAPSSWESFCVIAGAAFGLLLIGIRNVWDTVTHVVLSRPDGPPA